MAVPPPGAVSGASPTRTRSRRDGQPERRRPGGAGPAGAVRGQHAGQSGPDRAAGQLADRRAAGPLLPHPGRRPAPADPVRRPGPVDRRPARAGGLVPAATGDHLGQPGGQHRHGDLLPADRPEGRHLRDLQLHPGHRAADGDHTAQRDRLARPGADPDQPGQHQRPAARRAGRGHRSLGDPGQPGRAEGDRPAAQRAGLDGEADAGGAGPAGHHPDRRGRQAGPDPDCGGRQAVVHPAGRGPGTGRHPVVAG